MRHTSNRKIDLRGLKPPLPMLNATREIEKLQTGETIEICTDVRCDHTIPKWVSRSHIIELVDTVEEKIDEKTVYYYYIKHI